MRQRSGNRNATARQPLFQREPCPQRSPGVIPRVEAGGELIPDSCQQPVADTDASMRVLCADERRVVLAPECFSLPRALDTPHTRQSSRTRCGESEGDARPSFPPAPARAPEFSLTCGCGYVDCDLAV